jgi:5-methylcytosine-specific restriction enzyme A
MNLTIKQFETAIKKLTIRQIEVLQTLYYFPNSSATAKDLAFALNYTGFQAANRQIGQIGKSISNSLNYLPPEYSGKKGNQPAYFYVVGEYYQDTGWNMWDNLQKALENLQLINTEKEIFTERLTTETLQFEETELYKEGKVVQVFVNRYERNQKARLECIRHFGHHCFVCDFDFEKTYGDLAKGYIHVHHKTQLAEIGKEYKIDPIEDLIPVCPNCHSVLHLTKPTMTVEELKKCMKKSSR